MQIPLQTLESKMAARNFKDNYSRKSSLKKTATNSNVSSAARPKESIQNKRIKQRKLPDIPRQRAPVKIV